MTGVTVTGEDEVARALRGVADDLGDPRLVDEVTDRGRTLAAELAPRLTGALAGSITTARTSTGGVIESRSEYAGAQNSGVPSRNIPATRFMDRAAELLEPRAGALVDTALDRSIRLRGLK